MQEVHRNKCWSHVQHGVPELDRAKDIAKGMRTTECLSLPFIFGRKSVIHIDPPTF